MLPAPQERSRFERLKNFLGLSSSTSSPNHDDMQKKCLEIYLSLHRKMICDSELSPSRLTIPQAANGIVHIFRQLFTQKIHQYVTVDWVSHQLPKVWCRKQNITVPWSLHLSEFDCVLEYLMCVLL